MRADDEKEHKKKRVLSSFLSFSYHVIFSVGSIYISSRELLCVNRSIEGEAWKADPFLLVLYSLVLSYDTCEFVHTRCRVELDGYLQEILVLSTPDWETGVRKQDKIWDTTRRRSLMCSSLACYPVSRVESVHPLDSLEYTEQGFFVSQ